MWRSGWDSNPRVVSDKLISSQPRYDRFDTAPRGMTMNQYIMPKEKWQAEKFALKARLICIILKQYAAMAAKRRIRHDG